MSHTIIHNWANHIIDTCNITLLSGGALSWFLTLPVVCHQDSSEYLHIALFQMNNSTDVSCVSGLETLLAPVWRDLRCILQKHSVCYLWSLLGCSEPAVFSTTWEKTLLDQTGFSIQSDHFKEASSKPELNGCGEKPTRNLYIKPLWAFHARCPADIPEIRSKKWKWDKAKSLGYSG